MRRCVTWALLFGVIAAALPVEIAMAEGSETQSVLTSASSPCSEHAPDADLGHEGCLCPGCPSPMLPASPQTVLVAAARPVPALEHEFTHSLRSGDFGASVFRPPRRG